MDTRRLLILAGAGLGSGCASLDRIAPPALADETPASSVVLVPAVASPVVLPETARPYLEVAGPPETDAGGPINDPPEPASAARSGRVAIAAANREARAPSRSDQFVGGVQVFAWAPGRVYEVWTAPLRVTTLTLAPGETIVSKAAGDTVRWQIGETTSGTGALSRSHILLKPLERGLETNLVVTTSHRVYLLDLRSGAADGFNAAIAWDAPDRSEPELPVADPAPDPTVVQPQGPLEARYSIRPRGRAPRWTPTAVFNDGVRTFITLPPQVRVEEVPALFVLGPHGEGQLVNYRQAGGLLVVDRVFDRAELRLGAGREARIVRLERRTGDGA